MELYCSSYTDAFEKIVEVQQEAVVEDLTESVDLVLTDLPYNTLP